MNFSPLPHPPLQCRLISSLTWSIRRPQACTCVPWHPLSSSPYTFQNSLIMLPPAHPHRKLLKGQLKGALILVIPATLTIWDLLWPMERDQRWHVPWLRRSPKGIWGLYSCSFHSALREAWPPILSCFFNLSPAMKWPHRGQLAQSQDITWARNRHLLLEATEILGSICYTALSSKCQLTHGASQYS